MRICTVLSLLILLTLSITGDAQAQRAQNGNNANMNNGNIPRSSSNDNERDLRPNSGVVDTARTRGGRPEYVAIGPPSQTNAAATALTAAGARLIRTRAYPSLNRRALIVDLNRLPLGQARALLAQAAPQTQIDLHSLYRYAQGSPRLYASALIGALPSGGCRLSPRLRIGLIDGPLLATHPALRSTRIVTQSVLTGKERAPAPDHGTAVAALLIGQDPANALSGYAAGAQLFAATAFAREPRGPGADVERIGAALDWLAANRVRLVNMSFAGPVNSAFDNLLGAAAARGMVMIAAAGNDGKSIAAYPAAARPVIAVTAIDAARRRYRSANTGQHIEFAAPGVDLYVASKRGGAYASGTSYAAPIVTGLAARLFARGTTSTRAMRTALRRQSVDLGAPGRDTQFGWGLVRAPGC